MVVSNNKLLFRFITVNVRGIADSVKRRAIFDFHRKNADFLILQETHSVPEIESIWENEWGGKYTIHMAPLPLEGLLS